MSFCFIQASRHALQVMGLCAVFSAAALAQNAVGVAYLQGKAPVAPDAIAVLGPDLFGDKINLYNGSFSFEHTDVELPGNNALRVALVRQHSPGRQWLVRGAIADWDLNTPRIEGSFADVEGWVPIYGSAANRCSSFNMPPYVTRGNPNATDFSPDEYWQGTSIVVPGHGSQEILVNTGLPNQGGQWNLATRNMWQVGCLPSVQNAPGQGFVARSPDGVTYRFDWMAMRNAPALRKGDSVLGRRDMFLMATRVTDRFGNWVDYRYNAANPLQLERIESSDGRVITLQYTAGRVSSAYDGTRIWQYFYSSDGDLQTVVLPDASRWTFSLRSLVIPSGSLINEGNADCDTPPPILGYGTSGFMVHPSGARGTFYKDFLLQGRTNVDRICTYYGGELANYTNGSVHPRETVNEALEKKVISGPGMPDMVWEYWNGNNTLGAWAPCSACADRKSVIVVEPSGAKTRHTFGIRWRQNEGQLLRVEDADAAGNVLRTKDIRYRTAEAQAYPNAVGYSVRFTTDLVSTLNRPEDRRQTTQQGETFTWEADSTAAAFDGYARPLRGTASSTLGHSRTLQREYRDFPALWVMGQTGRVTEASTGLEVERTDFYENTGLPSAKYSFGYLTQSIQYHVNGLLHKLTDLAGKATAFDNFHRGQPQSVVFADGKVATQVVNNLGNVNSYTNEVNTTTSFEFDPMGRVNRIIYPTGDDEPYCDTFQYFSQSASAERGLEQGHWKQTISTCDARIERWFDGFWRIRLERKYDSSNANGTASTVETRYDGGGRKLFQSHSHREIPWVNTAVDGTSFEYDALDRVRYARATSELGPAPLVTETRYEPGFTKRVINPRGFSTIFSYQTFDEPAEENIKAISLPENVGVSIARDVFGKALHITRSGPGPAGMVSVTRSYGYDGFQRLCKTVEPETGATVQGYDASGNIAWRASGQPAGAGCDRAQLPSSAVISFHHGLRNRLELTQFGDGQSDITRTYWDDGALQTVNSSSFHWSYVFNNRRLLKSEAFSVPGQTPGSGWHFTRHIDRHGNVARLGDYWGTMYYEPTALGQPTKISGYVSQLSYHPNGMVANYRLNNGIWRNVVLNTRGLPATWQDTGVINDAYSYDANGNVTGIEDNPALGPPPPSPSPPVPPPPPPYVPPPPGCDNCHPQRVALQGRAGENTRGMAYDGLDRLTAANGPWGSGVFRYDAVDNLTYSQLGGRTIHHNIHAATNRLTSLSGSQSVGMGYDANGNLSSRDAQGYSFDIANRMRAVPGVVTYYDYDGHGRRSWVVWADGKTQLNAYAYGNASGSTGRLLFSAHSTKGATRYVYLGDKLIAEHNNLTGLRFSHTDALGSPVAWTNAAGAVTERTRYEPYGATVAGSTNPVSMGFTGHVNDADTGLVYMQQRYYDPIAGRFLSVDPVTTDSNTGKSFNRYAYAENNPYGHVDPDGRNAIKVFAAIVKALTKTEGKEAAKAGAREGAKDGAAAARAEGAAARSEGTAGGERAGKPMTPAGKEQVKSENAAQNGGQTTCSNCGQATVPAKQSEAGVTPPKNETHVDHKIPQSKGGDGSPSNGQVLCRDCNLKKSDK